MAGPSRNSVVERRLDTVGGFDLDQPVQSIIAVSGPIRRRTTPEIGVGDFPHFATIGIGGLNRGPIVKCVMWNG